MTDKNAPDDNNPIARRNFLLGASTAVAAGLTPTAPAQAQQSTAAAPAPAPEPDQFVTLTAPEAAFIVAAVDTLIPADELSPSGSECGVAVFIDRQLGSAWGGGAKMYRGGPFHKGKPEQGYQLPLTPRELSPPTPGRGRPMERTSIFCRPPNACRQSQQWRTARPSSRASIPAHSSISSSPSPCRGSSPIRFTAAIATRSPGR